MREWFTVSDALEVAEKPAPTTKMGWRNLIVRNGWREIDGKARQGARGWEYHVSLWPQHVRAALMRAAAEYGQSDPAAQAEVADRSGPLWDRYAGLPQRHKDTSAQRLAAVEAALAQIRAGVKRGEAIDGQAQISGVSARSLQRWIETVNGVPRADWLAALAPAYRPTAQFADCHPAAWETLKADYLRPEQPAFEACYRRLIKLAAAEGWSPIPSRRALRRRLSAEIEASVAAMKRQGRDAAKSLYPPQLRVKSGLHAMQVVNIDGHKFDVMVKRHDGKVFRPTLVALQDVYSGKFVAWRLDETENKVAVRLVIGDMVERFGIPEHIVLDNGRGFASKWITGGQPTRFRFKVRDDEPDGLLTALGVTVHWTKPYSGQSKPIERAFRDLCEDIAKHPYAFGAYTGNSPSTKPENYGARALAWADFRAFVDGMMAEHNARFGRQAATAAGRSFDETFRESMADPSTIVRRASAGQRSLWLLTAEAITARKPNGEIHLMGNRYWSAALISLAGKKVCVRFDPDDLTRPVEVCDLQGAKICDAAVIEDVNFLDADAARRHEQARRAFLRKQKELADMHVTLTPTELARLYAPPMSEQADDPTFPAVTRLATSTRPRPHGRDEQHEWTDEDEEAFGSVVDLMGRRLMRD